MPDDAASPIIDPSSGDRAARRQRKHWIEYGGFVLLLMTFGAAATAAFYTRQQWLTAQDTLVISQRAFLAFGDKDVDIGGDDWTDNFTIENTGNTRTRGLEFLIACRTATQPLKEPWVIFKQDTVDHRPQIIPAHAHIKIGCSFKVDEMQEMENHRIYGYIMGELRYRDIFSDTWHVTQHAEALSDVKVTHTARTKDAAASWNVRDHWEEIGAHNCADEDCPKD